MRGFSSDVGCIIGTNFGLGGLLALILDTESVLDFTKRVALISLVSSKIVIKLRRDHVAQLVSHPVLELIRVDLAPVELFVHPLQLFCLVLLF